MSEETYLNEKELAKRWKISVRAINLLVRRKQLKNVTTMTGQLFHRGDIKVCEHWFGDSIEKMRALEERGTRILEIRKSQLSLDFEATSETSSQTL